MRLLTIGMLFLSGMSVATGFSAVKSKTESAVFAGGSFRYLQEAFEDVYGVISVEAGYTGGTSSNPTPANYVTGGHVEAVRVTFDASRVGYKELLDVFWKHTNPTDPGGQFAERGRQFRPIVFWLDQGQNADAVFSKANLAKSGVLGTPVVTEIAKAGTFFSAGTSNQDYAKKNPSEYAQSFKKSGRIDFFAKVWAKSAEIETGLPPSTQNGTYKKPANDVLRRKLTPMQYEVTQKDGTEPPFDNEYWNNHEDGIYVDVVSGEPLFSSLDKFESGTGWPSFTMPLVPENIKTDTDTTFGMERSEVRSKYANSHLGHVFDDGPEPTGLRYCMDSAALKFIKVADLEKEGYGEYLKYFKK